MHNGSIAPATFATLPQDETSFRCTLQECANAIAAGTTLKDLAMMVHTHPTLCEVLDEAFKGGLGRAAH